MSSWPGQSSLEKLCCKRSLPLWWPQWPSASKRSFGLFRLEALLTQSFEKHQCNAIGQIERACFGIEHGDAQPAGVIFLEELPGQPCGLAAEDEVIVST